MSQFTNELSLEIYEHTYKYGDETLEKTQKRIAADIASIENEKDVWTNNFLSILEDFKFVPGGRIMSNAGTKIGGTTMINCFVSGFQGENRDSMEGIMAELKRQAMILKSEGGYGFCADIMRPRGGFISGIANESPGSVRMLDMWNTQSDVITAGSGKKSSKKEAKQKIRKGAQMVTMSCWNPSIEEFITAKQTPGRLDKFNMSVLITDDFMDAVENHREWNLIFPDFDIDKKLYDKEWDGNIKLWIEKGYPIKIWKTYKDANELWDLIMRSTYNRNEPGVLFIDTVNRLNNLYYIEYISSSNPCVVGDTLVFTNIGWIKIKNLNKYKKYNIKIITVDKDGIYFESQLKWVGITKKMDELYKVCFSNGEFLLTNGKHKFYKNNFDEINVSDIFDSKINIEVIGGNGLIKIMEIQKINLKEDVYDLTADPNYNFFSILNREEIISKDKIIINENIELNYFSIVKTTKGQKFAYEIKEGDDIL